MAPGLPHGSPGHGRWSLRYIPYWFGKPAEEIGPAELEEFVARATPAGHNLGYLGPSETPGELPRQVSALANAEGGLLILGVEVEREEDARGNLLGIRPRALRGIDAAGWEELRRTALAAITPPVAGLDARTIGLGQGRIAVLLDIPPSPLGVHRAPDGRYYTRRGFRDLPMEPEEVEAVRARRGRPKLLPRLEIARIEAAEGRLTLRVRLDNRGRRETRDPRVRLRLLGAEPLGGPPRGVEVAEAGRGAWEFRWAPQGRIAPGELTGSLEIPIRHEGDFAAEVELAGEGLPAETSYFLIPADVPREVQGILSGEEGWEVPPADRVQVLRWRSPGGPPRPHPTP